MGREVRVEYGYEMQKVGEAVRILTADAPLRERLGFAAASLLLLDRDGFFDGEDRPRFHDIMGKLDEVDALDALALNELATSIVDLFGDVMMKYGASCWADDRQIRKRIEDG